MLVMMSSLGVFIHSVIFVCTFTLFVYYVWFSFQYFVQYVACLHFVLYVVFVLFSKNISRLDVNHYTWQQRSIQSWAVRCIAMLKKYIEHTYLEHCTHAWIIPMENKDVHKQFHLILMSSWCSLWLYTYPLEGQTWSFIDKLNWMWWKDLSH